jgi:hypothetical protein
MNTVKNTKNYNLGKIYKIEPIIEHKEEDIYIGSTCKPLLSQRMTQHRKGYKHWKTNNKNFMTSYLLFDKYGLGNCEITLIENVNAKNIDELRAREKYYIKTMKCINKCVAGRTVKEYYIDNKNDILEQK